MTLLELLTGNVPYARIVSDGAVMRAVGNGALPDKPKCEGPDAKLKGDIWSLCCKCWTLNHEERPSMQDVLRDLIRTKYRRGVVFEGRNRLN